MAEKKKGFLLAEFMSPDDVSKSDTGAPALELIDIDLIDSNESNFYELSDLQALANSIAMDGLQQPLVVMTSAEDPQRVTLLSGHRRRAAIQMLVNDDEEPRPELRLVPCIRRQYSSPAMAELQLILANSTSRVLTAPEVMRQAERTEMLLYQLKEEGHSFPGKMRDHVAEACNASASKLARLKVIRERLEPEFLEAFEANKLSEDAAYRIAKGMSAGTQRIVIDVRTSGKKPLGLDIPANVADRIASGFEALKGMSLGECPSGGDCSALEKRMHSAARFNDSWSSSCTRCCSNCYSRNYCKTVCGPGKEKIKADVEKAEQQRERNAKAHEKQENKRKLQNKKFAERLMKIAPDEASRKKLGNITYSYASENIEEALAGNSCYYDFSEPRASEALAIAKTFDVSLDYIYGRSEDPHGGGITWTSVDDELPPLREWVLGICLSTDPQHVTTKLVEKKGEKVWLGCQIITHWAPLPAPPEVKM